MRPKMKTLDWGFFDRRGKMERCWFIGRWDDGKTKKISFRENLERMRDCGSRGSCDKKKDGRKFRKRGRKDGA